MRIFPESYLPFGCVAYLYVAYLYVAYLVLSTYSYNSLVYLSGQGVWHVHGGQVPSGSYLASNAAWEGDAAFKYLEATYEFPFSGLVATSASFFPSSSLVHDDFNEEGPRFPLHAHLTDDLLVWMHCQTFAQ
ncbi:hypothetical protein B484DRAFT_409187, partial [Ochromonadaceae sp. CCMP2298]